MEISDFQSLHLNPALGRKLARIDEVLKQKDLTGILTFDAADAIHAAVSEQLDGRPQSDAKNVQPEVVVVPPFLSKVFPLDDEKKLKINTEEKCRTLCDFLRPIVRTRLALQIPLHFGGHHAYQGDDFADRFTYRTEAMQYWVQILAPLHSVIMFSLPEIENIELPKGLVVPDEVFLTRIYTYMQMANQLGSLSPKALEEEAKRNFTGSFQPRETFPEELWIDGDPHSVRFAIGEGDASSPPVIRIDRKITPPLQKRQAKKERGLFTGANLDRVKIKPFTYTERAVIQEHMEHHHGRRFCITAPEFREMLWDMIKDELEPEE